jgi:hypothetical protein
MMAEDRKLNREELTALEELLGRHGIRSAARLSTVEHFVDLAARHGHRSEGAILSLLDLLLLLRRHGIIAVDEVLRRVFCQPTLAFIKIAFYQPKEETMSTTAPVPSQSTAGPVVLTVGQSTTASVLGFDQNGNPMPTDFVMPPVSFSVDSASFASSTPNSDGVTDAIVGVAEGVANLTASVTGPNGTLTDTETITVTAAVVTPPVLSSIKVAFTPAA